MRWIPPSPEASQVNFLAEAFDLSPVCARLLASRGMVSREATEAFLSPGLSSLSDPLLPGGMRDAVKRLEEALRREESVLIFGDYDVDGVTSTVFLVHFLRRFGLNPRYVIPRRLEEGYGLSIDSLERALAGGRPDLLVAVDCGTGSSREVAWLRERGVSVLILDHHTSKESLPADCILVNPHVHDSPEAPWRHLCSVGLVFKFCHAFLKIMRNQADPLATRTDLREYLDLVAMGTVADLVSLEGENRILVKSGLRRLQNCRRPGICALMDTVGLKLGDRLTPVDIGFRLGPRINASGRLNDATLPIKLLLSEDSRSCMREARLLDEFNRERQEIEKQISLQAEGQVVKAFPDDAGIVVASGEWHSGVVGIVASRLARKFNRPSLVLGSESDGLLKGSGRSIPGVDLVRILADCSGHIVQWGGHPMAVGLTIEDGAADEFRSAFNSALERQFPEGLPERTLQIDAFLQPGDLTVRLLEELEILEPFGQGNPEPVFALQGVTLGSLSPMGNGHLRFAVPRPSGRSPVEGVAWNGSTRPPPASKSVDIAVRFGWNTWRGQRSPRLTLVDWRPCR
jgi:single-stranded-DNA-specific exonuclease